MERVPDRKRGTVVVVVVAFVVVVDVDDNK